MLRFSQVNVFSDAPHRGNPVAVVHDADGLGDAEMAEFANWTNLSETTFLLKPTSLEADYRVRIFTPSVELPFAGHPTLGSAHAWLEAGGVPRLESQLVQECAAGLISVRRGERLQFEAPPLIRSGAVSDVDAEAIVRGLGLAGNQVIELAWIDNGPGWVGVLVDSAQTVLSLDPNWVALSGWDVGVVGPYPVGAAQQVEVRAFCAGKGMDEDPVTGSLNAGLAQWLIGTNQLPPRYVAAQGTALGRSGRVHVEQQGSAIWIGGATSTVIRGEVAFGPR